MNIVFASPKASMAEGISEHGLIGNALGAREACRQLLEGLFHHHGISPQRIDINSAVPLAAGLTTSTGSVGATL